VRAGVVLGGIALVLIAVGAAVLIRMGSRYQRERAESETKYRSLFENAEVGMFRTRMDGSEILDHNERLAAIFGRPGERLEGTPSTVYWADPREREEMVRRLVSDGVLTEFECRVRTKRGDQLHCLASAHLHREEGILEGSILDITARTWAEESLREERDRAQRYLDVAGVMILALDRDGQVSLINPRGCEILAGSREDIVGQNWFERFVPPQGRDEVKAEFERLLAGDAAPAERHENWVVGLDGVRRLVSWRNAVVTDAHGAIGGMLSSGEDVTERRQLERDALEVAERERERIGQDLHDVLGQQLTAAMLMLGAIEHAPRPGAAPPAHDLLEVRRLIEVALAQARFIAHGFLPIAEDAMGLPDALEDLATNTQKLFGVSCVSRAPDGAVAVDRQVGTHLYHIAQEAITNAIRHGHATSVALELGKSDGRVELRIVDDGSGMPDVPPTPSAGKGMRIMQTRATTIGGRLTVGRGRPGGTVVTCAVPAAPLRGGRPDRHNA
jgi:PAS domain S-box-containing protein